MLVNTIAVLYLFIYKAATSKFHCVGICYSGRWFPLPKDIVYGKHLKGYSYRNITTDDAKKCYSSCVNDCRCKACQTKDARCELLDEDHTSKPSDFVDASGYVYYHLLQEFYKGKSHMVQPGVCHNGCCQSQPCLNGGTCIEHCDTPKKKFTCTCPSYHGKVCEKRYTSCMDILKSAPPGTNPAHGIYTIVFNKKARNVICDFERAKVAWTLMESFSLSKNKNFRTVAFHQLNKGRRGQNPNWVDFRARDKLFAYTRNTTTMFRVTCDFPNRGGVLTPDYLFGYLSDYDIINHGDVDGECFKFAYINIRGLDFFNKTARVYQIQDLLHFHIDAEVNRKCELVVPEDEAVSEDLFGFYISYSTASRCTQTMEATTQLWLGEEI